jgi:ankyrin repeat protein
MTKHSTVTSSSTSARVDSNINQQKTASSLLVTIPKDVIRPFLDTYIELFFGRMAHEVNEHGMTPLLEATDKGDETSVFLLLLYGSMNLTRRKKEEKDVEKHNDDNGDSSGGICYSYDQHAHVNARVVQPSSLRYELHMTALHIAARWGWFEIARLLVDHGAECHVKDQTGWTPLAWSVQEDHEALVKLFLRVGETLDDSATTTTTTTELLNWKDEHGGGETLLHLAARHRSLSIAKLLLLKMGHCGLDVNVRCQREYRTPLHHAAIEGNQDMIQLFLDHGADSTVTDRKYRKTALHYLMTATSSGKDATILQSLLLQQGALVNGRDYRGCTALHLAASCSNNDDDDENEENDESYLVGLDRVRRLLEHGGDPTLRNDYGESLLHCAAQGGSASIVRLLLAYEVATTLTTTTTSTNTSTMINSTDRQGETPLHCAIQLDHGAVAQLLLERGANINQTDASDHRTALYMAVQMNLASMVQLLVEWGADKEIPDQYGRTPRDLAAVYGLESIYPFLC